MNQEYGYATLTVKIRAAEVYKAAAKLSAERLKALADEVGLDFKEEDIKIEPLLPDPIYAKLFYSFAIDRGNQNAEKDHS